MDESTANRIVTLMFDLHAEMHSVDESAAMEFADRCLLTDPTASFAAQADAFLRQYQG